MNGMNALLAALLGTLFAGSLIVAVLSWRGQKIRLGNGEPMIRLNGADQRRLILALGAALVVGLVTRWPIAAIGAGTAVFIGPKMFGAGKVGERELERIEALATWTESLRDTIAGSISLEQAIPATLDAAPPQIAEPLGRLVGLLRGRVPLPEALTQFAEDLDDTSADLVVAALILNSRLRGPGLERTLSELAIHAREELELRQQVEAGRKTIRRTAKIVVGITIAWTFGMVLFSREYAEPFSTTVGQGVLLGIFVVFSGAFMWMRRLSEYRKPKRFLIAAIDAAGLLGASR